MTHKRNAAATDTHSTSSASLFAQCTPQQRAQVDKLATPVEVRAGYELTHEGAIAKEFGVITAGTASVTIKGERVATLGPGDYYGEVGLLDEIGHTDGRRMATITAETDMWVSAMSVREFWSLFEDVPSVADAIRRAARDRVQAQN